MFLQGFWRQQDTDHPLHLLDLSLSGTRAHASTLPELGSHIFIRCGVDLGLAQVSWIRGPYFGSRFLVALRPTVLNGIAGIPER